MLSYNATPQPTADKVRPVAPEPVKAPVKKPAAKPDKYKPFTW